jgi:hypothetical protein
MVSEKFNKEDISIKNLSLWDENARFPDKYFGKYEKELIAYFCSVDDFKILKFAKEIVNDFDLPQIEKFVVYRVNEQNIVLEGNRRLVAYKLLSDPNLTDDKKLKEKLLNLKSKISISGNFEIECLVTLEIEEGYRYIERKHLHQNNEISWKDNERAHHKNRIGKANQQEKFKVAITKIIRGLDLPENMKDSILGQGYVTNLWRIINSSPAWKEYDFKIDEHGDLTIGNKEFKENLKVIIVNVLQKETFSGEKIDSRSLNKNEEKEKYLKSITREDYKKAEIEIKKQSEKDSSENSRTEGKEESASKKGRNQKKGRSKPLPKGLFYPSDVPYKLSNSSLRFLYEELRKMKVDVFPNATHDLLRSFLECSLIVFFKKSKEFTFIQKKDQHNPTLGEMLTHIINGKCKKISDANLISTIKQIKTDYCQPYSLQRLNMINHNENWSSTPREVRTAWARLEELFKLILSS